MKHTIDTLKQIYKAHSISFINNSIIKIQSLKDSPIPDTQYDLHIIIELKTAIAILETYNKTNEKTN
jgi:hypothetical protein